MQKIKSIIAIIANVRKYGKYVIALFDVITYAQARFENLDKETDLLTYKDVKPVDNVA